MNWNGDKYRRGSSRDAADWISESKSSLSPGSIVFMTGRRMGFFPMYTIYEVLENGDVTAKKQRQPDPVNLRVIMERRRKLNEMWFQCEPCER